MGPPQHFEGRIRNWGVGPQVNGLKNARLHLMETNTPGRKGQRSKIQGVIFFHINGKHFEKIEQGREKAGGEDEKNRF